MKLYSARLANFAQDDILAAIDQLMLTKRQQGETAFPDLATVVEAVELVALRRRQAEAAAKEKAAREAEERNRKEHPENYFNMADVYAEVKRRGKVRLLEAPKPAKPRGAFCEHCNGIQLSALTPSMLRDLADVLEKQRSIR
jgi:hypothetical protein